MEKAKENTCTGKKGESMALEGSQKRVAGFRYSSTVQANTIVKEETDRRNQCEARVGGKQRLEKPLTAIRYVMWEAARTGLVGSDYRENRVGITKCEELFLHLQTHYKMLFVSRITQTQPTASFLTGFISISQPSFLICYFHNNYLKILLVWPLPSPTTTLWNYVVGLQCLVKGLPLGHWPKSRYSALQASENRIWIWRT